MSLGRGRGAPRRRLVPLAGVLPLFLVVLLHHRDVWWTASRATSIGDADRVLLHSIAFIAGFTTVFVSLGASFSVAGQLLLDYRDWIRIAGGSLIVIFGLYIAGVLRIGLFGRSQQLHIQSKPAGFIGSFAVGLTFAIGWTPCVGPILGSILTLASNDTTLRQGIALLLAYSAGLGVPFLLSSIALGGFLRFFKRYRPFIPTVERAAGVLLVAVGILVITNYYIVLNAWALGLTPDWLLKRL